MIRLEWMGQRQCPRCRSPEGFELLKLTVQEKPANWPKLAMIRCQACRGLFIRNCREVACE